jgi:dTDP-4-dehydrorhamnose reductase
MRILVTGVNGQLGHDVVGALSSRDEVIGVGRKEMDLEDTSSIEKVLSRVGPDCIIHCGAYTKVDQAEIERKLCTRINVEATATIARMASTMGSKLVYISTDYVFDGTKAGEYETNDSPNPINFYGLTKLIGERVVAETSSKHFIIRTSWVFGINGNNFVKVILRKGREQGELRVVRDQVGSPTYSKDLARLISKMVITKKYGLFHATNEGACSWYEFAKEVLSMSGVEVRVEPISSEQYGAKAMRPLNSRLSMSSLDEAGFHRLPEWRDALCRYLQESGALRGGSIEAKGS